MNVDQNFNLNHGMRDNTIKAFFALVRAGLWEKDVYLSSFGEIDYNLLLLLAEEQSVVGLVAAGIEHVKDIKVPKKMVLQLVGQILQIEQQNAAMNYFIGVLVDKMRGEGINTLLVKGQGIAQCYEKPLWRTSGDVDFFLSEDNFHKAKDYLLPLSSGNKPERLFSKELWMKIDSWYVELHGTLRTGLSTRVDKVIDIVQRSVFYEGKVRSWVNSKTQVFLPAADEDVFFVFTHFIKHFYKEGGVSLRQLCDWCRLLWTYQDSLNHELLKSRIRKAGLTNEWKGFATVVVDWLGMSAEAMPMYCIDKKWNRKADKIVSYILAGGKWHKIKDTIKVGGIFPMSTLRFLPGILWNINRLKIKERLLGI